MILASKLVLKFSEGWVEEDQKKKKKENIWQTATLLSLLLLDPQVLFHVSLHYAERSDQGRFLCRNHASEGWLRCVWQNRFHFCSMLLSKLLKAICKQLQSKHFQCE